MVNPQVSLLNWTLEADIPGNVMWSLIDGKHIVSVTHQDGLFVNRVDDGLDEEIDGMAADFAMRLKEDNEGSETVIKICAKGFNTTCDEDSNTTCDEDSNTTCDEDLNTTCDEDSNTTCDKDSNTTCDEDSNTTCDEDSNTTCGDDSNTIHVKRIDLVQRRTRVKENGGADVDIILSRPKCDF